MTDESDSVLLPDSVNCSPTNTPGNPTATTVLSSKLLSESESDIDDDDSSPHPPPSTTSPPPDLTPTNAIPGQKLCHLCHRPFNILIRCQIDSTRSWYFLCTGKCWVSISGGQVDGLVTEEGRKEYPYYCYGGMWKNKKLKGGEKVSAKIKGKAKRK